MKKLISLCFLTLLSLSLTNSFAKQTKGKKMLQVLDSYLKIQASLANDSLDGVQAEAAQIAKLSADKEIKILAQTMSHNTLDAARVDFKKLSVAMATWAQKAKPKDLARLSCSMANASWLQKKGATRNPYYGKQMLECGEVLP